MVDKEIENIIQKEIDWCKANSYKKGYSPEFIKGLQQALYLISKLDEDNR